MATMNLKRVKDKIELCLKNIISTRECDMQLVMTVWAEFYPEESNSFVVELRAKIGGYIPYVQPNAASISNLPSFESIRRVRQKFNEEGLYLPSEETQRKRGRKTPEVQEDLREWN